MRAQKISATIAGLGLAGLLAAPLMPAANAIPIIPGGGSGGGNAAAAAADENTADGGDNVAADTNKDGAGNENNGTISGLDDDEADGAAAGGNGKSITSTVTTTTTPAPAGNGAGAGAGATAAEPAPAGATDVTGTGTGADQAVDPAAQPAQEELALTGNSTQVFAATLAVLALLAAGGYVVAMRRTV